MFLISYNVLHKLLLILHWFSCNWMLNMWWLYHSPYCCFCIVLSLLLKDLVRFSIWHQFLFSYVLVNFYDLLTFIYAWSFSHNLFSFPTNQLSVLYCLFYLNHLYLPVIVFSYSWLSFLCWYPYLCPAIYPIYTWMIEWMQL